MTFTDKVENLLADELYDGAFGALSEEAMEKYRRALAEKITDLVNEEDAPRAEPTDNQVNQVALEYFGVSAVYDKERLRNALRSVMPRQLAVRDTQWYAYWTGVHQAVQHWADGAQMQCPYPQPPVDTEYHCAQDPGCNIKYGGQAPNQEHSANCAQINRVPSKAGEPEKFGGVRTDGWPFQGDE